MSPARLLPLDLIPQPRSIKLDRSARILDSGGPFAFAPRSRPSEADRFALGLLNRGVGSKGRSARRTITLIRPAEPKALGEERYQLTIDPAGVTIEAASDRARYYAIQTLRQLTLQYGARLPCLVIEDAPAFEHRGFMHDVSRGKVPRLSTLFELVEQLASLKYNHLQLYIEHTYAFARHPLIGRGHSPLTATDLKRLAEHCARHHVTLAPNLQSFGHAHYTLVHPRYRRLAESDYRGGWTLSPVEPGTYKLLGELYQEFLPNFPAAPAFNVGCDETYDLGRGKSATEAQRIGLGRVYLNHLLRVRDLVTPHGRRTMFWGDIILKYPKLVDEIPDDVILLNWWYEASGGTAQVARRLAPARRAGLEQWICPGTSSWNSLFFRRTNAQANLRDSAIAGERAGATGYLVTDWGDNGHYNFLSHSLWPIAYGADCAWRARPDREAEARFDNRFCRLMLDDPAGEWIEPLRVLGDLYLAFGVEIENNSAERWLLTGEPDPSLDRLGVSGELRQYNPIGARGLKRARTQATRAIECLESLTPPSKSLRAVRDEWLLGARLARHACARALVLNHGQGDPAELRREIKRLASEFQSRWLVRNRRSDLRENIEDFRRVELAYRKGRLPKVRFG